MSDHPYVPVPASTSLGKSFEYGLDVNLGTTGSPSWQPVRRMSGWTPSFPATTQDVSSYDDRGARNQPDSADQLAGLAFLLLQGRMRTGGINHIHRTSFGPLGADGNGREERADNFTITLDNLEVSP